jgi:hypothetical protein
MPYVSVKILTVHEIFMELNVICVQVAAQHKKIIAHQLNHTSN